MFRRFVDNFEGTLLFECNVNEFDINQQFHQKPFLKDIRMAWSNLNTKRVIYNYGNDVIWDNSYIRVDENSDC